MENEIEKKVIERRRDRKKEREIEIEREREMLIFLDLLFFDSFDWLVDIYFVVVEFVGSIGCIWRLGGIFRYRIVVI